MSESVKDTFRGKLIYKLTHTAIEGGALVSRQGTTREEEEHHTVVVGLHCHLLDKYIMALEEWVPPPALEALQAEIGQYVQGK